MKSIGRTLARLTWLANCNAPQAVLRFRAKNPKYIPGDMAWLIATRLLRQIWKGGKEASKAATQIFCWQERTIGSVINSIKRASKAGAELPLSEDAALLLFPNRVDWPSGKLVYEWPSDLQKDLYLLLSHSHLAKVCARPDCAAPHFIARRATQDYCSTDCADAMQRKWKLDWWNKGGNEWRKNRKRKSKKQRSKNRRA